MPIDAATTSLHAAISDADIAILCEVARASGRELAADKKAKLPDLESRGLIVESQPDAQGHPTYQLTPTAQSILDERGVGVGEG